MSHRDPVLVASPQVQAIHGDQMKKDHLVWAAQMTKEVSVVADSASSSNLSFSTMLSPTTIIDRCAMISYQLRVVITTTGNAALGASDFCLARFPLNRIIKSATVTLNNASKTVEPHILTVPFATYTHNYEDEATYYACPSQADYANNVFRSSRLVADGDSLLTSGLPIESQFRKNITTTVNSVGSRNSRGCFPAAVTVAGGSITLDYEVTEPLFHPFFEDVVARDYLCNISQLRIDLTLSNNEPMFQSACIADGASVLDGDAAVAVTFPKANTKPVLLLRTYVSPIGIPRSVTTHYNELIVKQFTVGNLAVGASTTYTTNQIQLPAVPEKLLIFARYGNALGDLSIGANDVAKATRRTKQADAFAAISQLTVRTDVDNGSLVNAKQGQLFQMCKRNGSAQSWTEFSGLQGSVIMLDLNNSDLGGYVAGSNQSFMFDVQATLTNTTHDTISAAGVPTGDTYAVKTDWALYVVAIIPGKMTTEDNILNITLGHSQTAVANAISAGLSDTAEYDADSAMRGQGFWKSTGKWFKRRGKDISSVVKYGTKTLDAVAPALMALQPELAPEIMAAQQMSRPLADLVKGGPSRQRGGGMRLQG